MVSRRDDDAVLAVESELDVPVQAASADAKAKISDNIRSICVAERRISFELQSYGVVTELLQFIHKINCFTMFK